MTGGGDKCGRQGGGGGGIAVPHCARRPFIRPRLGGGGSGSGGGQPLQWRAAGVAVPDSWAQARMAGGRRRQRRAQWYPGAVAPQVRCPPPRPRRPDGPTVMTMITAPALRPTATLAMATPLGMTMPPPPPLLAKRTTWDRRTKTVVVTTGTTMRTMTSGGGVHSSTCSPPCHHCLLATLSAMPLLRPARCCRASRCLGSMSNTTTP